MPSDHDAAPDGGGRSAMVRDLVDSIADQDAGDAPGAPGKVCCRCGRDVAGQTRFKDAHGRYWCHDCGMEDHVRKHPEDAVACESCGEKFCPTKLVEIDDKRVCAACHEKVLARHKREAARHARAEADAREAAAKHRRLVLITSAVAGAGVAGLVLYAPVA